jgi:hypothetical protein
MGWGWELSPFGKPTSSGSAVLAQNDGWAWNTPWNDNWQKKPKYWGEEKSAPIQRRQLKIPYGQTWDGIRAAAMVNRRRWNTCCRHLISTGCCGTYSWSLRRALREFVCRSCGGGGALNENRSSVYGLEFCSIGTLISTVTTGRPIARVVSRRLHASAARSLS